MAAAKVRAKGQFTIPVDLRRQYGIKPGTKVYFIERGSEILMQPVTRGYIRSLCGMLKTDSSATKELLRERASDKQREERKLKSRREKMTSSNL